jgi:GNAT superfamily N-acetyltransferase
MLLSMAQSINIIRLTNLPRTLLRARADVDAIFYETAPRAPADSAARAAFYDVWLGQYLRHEPELAHVALSDGHIVGYLVGCHTNPAVSPRFASLAYFQTFAAACARYPAHLHINLTEAARGSGTGARLIAACVADAAAAGLPGVHVVTSSSARNVGFYTRNGFAEVAATERGGGRVVFLGRLARG